jgi:hypothetical protein
MLRFIKLTEVIKAEELTGVAYQLKANTAGSAVTAASEVLLLANPGLRDLKRIPAGTLVLVPDAGGRVPPARESAPVEIPLDQGALLNDKQIASLAADTAEAAKAAKQRATDTTAVLRLARKLIPEVAPGVETLFDKIAEQAERDADAAQKLAKSMRKVFERMAEDMKLLQDRSRP